MKKDNIDELKSLGSKKTDYLDTPSIDILETFPNQFAERNYEIKLEFHEFTSLCPKTGQPDFASIIVTYTPAERCLETKSLKLYFFSYRQQGAFMETTINSIFSDLVQKSAPKKMEVKGIFNSRGGIQNIVTCSLDEG